MPTMTERGNLPRRYIGSTWWLGLAGLVAVAAGWLSGLNVNLLYLVYLVCTYLIAQILIPVHGIKIALLPLLLFFLLFNPAAPLPEELEETLQGTVIEPNANRTYIVELAGLDDRRKECGPFRTADIFVQGRNLVPSLRVDRGTIADQQVHPFYNITKLRAQLELPLDV